MYKIFRLIIVAIVLTYFIGCFWYFFVNLPSNSSAANFATSNGLPAMPNSEKLIICSYFTMTTLTTVGYGDYLPITNLEKILAVIIMIVGIGFFSYIMGSFNDVLSNYEDKIGGGHHKGDL